MTACLHDMSEFAAVFARRLAETRTWAGISQSELARKLGISASLVSLWESADREPSADQAMEVAKQLGVSTEYLLQEETVVFFPLPKGLPPDERSAILATHLCGVPTNLVYGVSCLFRKARHAPMPFPFSAAFSHKQVPELAARWRQFLGLPKRCVLEGLKAALGDWHVHVIESKLRPEIAACSYRGPFTLVILNYRYHPTQRLFYLAQHLGHLLFHLGQIVEEPMLPPKRRETMVTIQRYSNEVEAEASAFAAELLLPAQAAHAYWHKELPDWQTPGVLTNSAFRHGIPPEILARQMPPKHQPQCRPEAEPPPANPPQNLEQQIDPVLLSMATDLCLYETVKPKDVAEWFQTTPQAVEAWLERVKASS